jgi:hypothetical protein
MILSMILVWTGQDDSCCLGIERYVNTDERLAWWNREFHNGPHFDLSAIHSAVHRAHPTVLQPAALHGRPASGSARTHACSPTRPCAAALSSVFQRFCSASPWTRPSASTASWPLPGLPTNLRGSTSPKRPGPARRASGPSSGGDLAPRRNGAARLRRQAYCPGPMRLRGGRVRDSFETGQSVVRNGALNLAGTQGRKRASVATKPGVAVRA